MIRDQFSRDENGRATLCEAEYEQQEDCSLRSRAWIGMGFFLVVFWGCVGLAVFS